MILMIDNYDSFTFNIVQYIKVLNYDIYTVRNDAIDIDSIRKLKPECIIISPGPKAPKDAGICLDIIHEFKGQIPILGICLGHQCIGEAFGSDIVHARSLMHGKTSIINSLEKGIFKEFSRKQFIATRYHSLAIKRETLPDCLEITCETDDGEIMGVKHKDYDIEGLQFHPEAILTEGGYEMLKIFLDRCNCKAKINPDSAAIDNTMFSSDNDVFFSRINIQLKQEIETYEYDGDFYSGFLSLYNYSDRYHDCAFLDSAGGPITDCNFSAVAIDKQFTVKLKNGLLIIEGVNKRYIDHLSEALSIYFKRKNGCFDISGYRFSKIFNLIKSSFYLDILHDKKLIISVPLIGYFTYEYLHYLESVPKNNVDPLDFPDVELSFYSTIIYSEYKSKSFSIISNYDTIALPKEHIIKCFQNPYKHKPKVETNRGTENLESWIKQNISKEKYLEIVEKCKKYIVEGDIFQVQISMREEINAECELFDVYNQIRRLNPSPYMSFIQNDTYTFASNSPELQFSVVDGHAMIRPIAGTSKGKGQDADERAKVLEEFSKDKKENAEHIMLVDLARNDIGRMAVKGSVHVPDLLKVEEYSNFFHMTSTVKGKLQSDLNSMELFEATFPAGTLTGAPKIRAMEIISELEPEKRGPYGGAIGCFDFNGNIISSIIIRTAIKKDGRIYIQAAAGTVADSIPENEWNEVLNKLGALRQSITNVCKTNLYKSLSL
ncbi:chorismate-binding protein [Ruminiclostridium herbifermentans]|uniref:aminodeoxychorismate synthase n=1 Tax=Ruminiclostridium herbifermentans TaxID=2488810 RepID=A0A4U7JM37_9FIRM|nr:chorismate-binding protein [Ruminiclostridium herbifermentans]QNU66262.1 chorismate-binding protein [Ruminiclostridium herbifermentans]